MQLRKIKNSVLVILCLFIVIFAKDLTINSSAQALSVSEFQQGVLMENAVNIKTPGYRTIKVVSYSEPKTGNKFVRKTNNFTPGPLVITNRPFDLSIEGKGFFVVADEQGRMFFTRDGRFQLNGNMQMVSLAGGMYVLDESDSPIDLSLGLDIIIDEKGYIYDSNNNVITRLKIVDIYNTNFFRSANNVLFYVVNEDIEQIYIPEGVFVRQGSYESSNVDYNKLMVELADKSLYTANTQMIQTRLKMLDSLNGLVNQN